MSSRSAVKPFKAPVHLISQSSDRRLTTSDVSNAYIEYCREAGEIKEPSFCVDDPQESGRWVLLGSPRPWLAAQLCRYDSIPVVLIESEVSPSLTPFLEASALDPMSTAELHQSLKEERGLTDQQLATQLGIDRSTLTHSLRLLHLDPLLKDGVRNGTLYKSFGIRASALDFDEQKQLLRQFERTGRVWSIRDIENIIDRIKKGTRTTFDKNQPSDATETQSNRHLERLGQELGAHLGTEVEVTASTISISWYGDNDIFEGLVEKMGISLEA